MQVADPMDEGLHPKAQAAQLEDTEDFQHAHRYNNTGFVRRARHQAIPHKHQRDEHFGGDSFGSDNGHSLPINT
jgi:hypothetical protein